jgi:hypothetical protein
MRTRWRSSTFKYSERDAEVRDERRSEETADDHINSNSNTLEDLSRRGGPTRGHADNSVPSCCSSAA